MTKWNEQGALNNNLETSDMKPKQSAQAKSKSGTVDGDRLNNVKIQKEIMEQNL